MTLSTDIYIKTLVVKVMNKVNYVNNFCFWNGPN